VEVGGFDPDNQADPESAGAWSETLDTFAYGEGDLLLPGEGDSHPECGVVRVKGFCDGATRDGGEETHIVYGKHLCGRRECPRCWSSEWTDPRTVSVVQRLGAARYAAEETQGKRAVHAVFSRRREMWKASRRCFRRASRCRTSPATTEFGVVSSFPMRTER
jgi:hypothetical protein